MVILRQVVLARRGVSKGHHLGGDRAKAMLGKSERVIIEALLDERGVVTRSVPDRVKGGTVLRTYIVSLVSLTLGSDVEDGAVKESVQTLTDLETMLTQLAEVQG